MDKNEIEWCKEMGIWLEPEDETYTGYWYLMGYEYQYQYVPSYSEYTDWELEKVTTSPVLVSKYRSRSFKAIYAKMRELEAKNGHKCDGELAGGIDWWICQERDITESDYIPREFIEVYD